MPFNSSAAKAVKEFEDNVTRSVAARDTFKAKIEKFSQKYPARAQEFKVQLQRMATLVEKKKDALHAANASLKEGDLKLEEMKAYWDMSQTAQELNAAAGMDTGDSWEKLKADTACEAVFESMNLAFAQLEVAAMLEVSEEPKAIAHNPSDVLEISAIDVTQKVKV